MIKNVILITLMLFLSTATYSQESFKKSIEEISSDLCSKMTKNDKKKVVVLFVTDINKAQTTAGKYMADVVSYYIVNNQNGFSVFDRENLSGIAEAKKLIAEGYIDASNAKQLGKLLSVEAIVVGNYTVLSESLSLTLKALDVNDGFVIAQCLKDLPVDKDAAILLGISSLYGSQSNLSNKGFDNQPLNSNESYNNPETVNKDCESKNLGNLCFANTTAFKLYLILDSEITSRQELTLEPNETQCLYNLVSGVYNYDFKEFGKPKPPYSPTGEKLPFFSRTGQINVEKCKSKTFVIR